MPLMLVLGSLGISSAVPSPPPHASHHPPPPSPPAEDDDMLIVIVGVVLGVVILLLCIFLCYLNFKMGEKDGEIMDLQNALKKAKAVCKDVKDVVVGTVKETISLVDDKTADAAVVATKAGTAAGAIRPTTSTDGPLPRAK